LLKFGGIVFGLRMDEGGKKQTDYQAKQVC
jgi:hypothetical protein